MFMNVEEKLMETCGDRIKKLRLEKGWSQAVLGEKAGVSQGTIGLLETGSTENSRFLPSIAEALGTTVEYLRDGLREPPSNIYAFIPRYKAKGAAGNGYENGDHVEVDGSHAFRRDWLKNRGLNPAHLKVIEVSGDSMRPDLHDGDVVLIDTADKTLKDGEVYALQTPDGTRIKRVIMLTDGRIRLASDNPDKARFPNEDFTPEEASRLVVIGKKVWRGG